MAQTPPAPGAILIAGSTPARLRATEVVMHPLAVALGPDGSLYIADFQRVWRVGSDAILTAVPGPWDNSGLVTALAVDRNGNLFVAGSKPSIWKVDPQGNVTVLAGPGSPTSSASSLAVDSQGNLYIGNNVVWKLAPDGVVSLFADGLIYVARLAVDASGHLYINAVSGLWRSGANGALDRVVYTGLPQNATIGGIAVDASGVLTVGLQYTDGSGDIGRIGTDGVLRLIPRTAVGCAPVVGPPSDIAIDRSGALYFADPANVRVRRLDPDGSIHTVAGGPGGTFAGDGGQAAQARLAHPAGLALDSKGNLYFADEFNNRIRRVDPSGVIDTIVGSGSTASEDLACTDLSENSLLYPGAVVVDPGDNLYIADTGHHRILKRTPAGAVTILPGTTETLDTPSGLAFAFGNLYIADKNEIRFIDSSGVIRTFYPTPNPMSVAVDAAGNVFAGNQEISNSGRVFVLPTGVRTHALAVGAGGELYSADEQGLLSRVESDCSTTLLASNRLFDGIAVAPNGDIFVSDSENNLIWRIPAPAGHGAPPVSLPFVSVVNGATLVPRTTTMTEQTRFGPIVVTLSVNEVVAPGQRISISGTCLAPLQFQEGGAGLETQVLFDGVPAPILSAGPNQVIAVVPYEIAGRSSTSLEVRYHGQTASAKLDAAPASVGIFPVSGAAFTRGTVASLLITGEGQTNPPRETGQPADGSPRQPVAPVQVKVNRAIADVISIAPDAGTIGSTRVTFRVPDSAPAGQGIVMVIVGTSFNSITATVI